MEKKRKFLFVSLTGLVGDIAWQVLKEGHEVRYFIGDPEEKDIADGFVPKTDDWGQMIDRTQAPNVVNDGIAKSLTDEIGAGRGDWNTPASSKLSKSP